MNSNELLIIDSGMSERIWKTRKEKKLSQEKLADLAKIETQTVKRIEKCRKGGSYRSTINTVAKLVDVLGISLEYVMGDLYTENREKWNSIIDRWKRIQDSGDHWITFSGSGWNGTLDDMKITCNDYPVDQLIFAICDQGGRNLILDSLKRYDESKNCQN